jgi:hypothetical protein
MITFSIAIYFGYADSNEITQKVNCPDFFFLKGEDVLCTLSLSSGDYHINNRGKVYRIKEDIGSDFQLELEHGFRLERVFIGEYGGDLIVAYECGDGESVFSCVVRIDGRALETKWTLRIPHMNISFGTMKSKYLYQTAHGFISKIDMDSGSFIWKHDNLYDRERYSFNSFQTPVIDGDTILFIEEKIPITAYKAPRVIRVDDQSGHITIE